MPGDKSFEAVTASSETCSPSASVVVEYSGAGIGGAERPSWPLSLLPHDSTCRRVNEMSVDELLVKKNQLRLQDVNAHLAAGRDCDGV